MWQYNYTNELMHYGVKGMKWGVRKAKQQYRATVKSAKNRMYDKQDKIENKLEKDIVSINNKYGQYRNNTNKGKNTKMNSKTKRAYNREIEDNWNKYVGEMDKTRSEYKQEKKAAKEAYKQTDEYKAKAAKTKKALKVGAAVAGTALAAYGAYKLTKFVKDKNIEIMTQKGKDEYRKITDKLMSATIHKNKDGTFTVSSSTLDGKSFGEAILKNYEGATKYHTSITKGNTELYKEAEKVLNEYLDKGYDAKISEAAKNVYNHYKENNPGLRETVNNAIYDRYKRKRR